MMMGSLLSFYACSDNDREAERLNEIAYSQHYRSLEKTRLYADSVLHLADVSADQRAEALNNMAFYHIGKMRYNVADSLLREVYRTTDNNIELLVASVQNMRICQRKSDNKDYYQHRQRALQRLRRIKTEQPELSAHERDRLLYAESELYLVSSVYDYYVGNTDAAVASHQKMDSIVELKRDTAQYVAYLYNVGSGGILRHGTKENIAHQEQECLMMCYIISKENGYTYWCANVQQAFSEQMMDNPDMEMSDERMAYRYLGVDSLHGSFAAGALADHALKLFKDYGDVYQQAAAWRTLSRCYTRIGDYPGAVYSLQQAMKTDTAVVQAPALMASLHEQFSIAFSAMDMKPESDCHRNMYLDLYENTRQDKQLEARAEQLAGQVQWLNILIYIIICVVAALMLLLLYLLVRRKRMSRAGKPLGQMNSMEEDGMRSIAALDEQLEESEEQCAVTAHELSSLQEIYVEHRAKMHLINSMTPLIDRMLHETSALCAKAEDDVVREERRQYIAELAERINSQNDVLTEWIKLKQGELSLNIETFPIQPLLDIIRKNTASYTHQGLRLEVNDTSETVKADRSLTLFMLNTLCDNARKFTAHGGFVRVSAKAVDGDMVELSVEDNGCGMDERQMEHIFDVKPIVDEVTNGKVRSGMSHGFGLLNCKGIIEKYKKTNSLFSSCMIGVESGEGRGSRFFFRLPKGVRRIYMAFVAFALSLSVNAQDFTALADSVYDCNVKGKYADALVFAERCIGEINRKYVADGGLRNDTLMFFDREMGYAADMRWLRDSVPMDYQLLMSVRNEIAVSALALHKWDLYTYNNRIYTQMYKEYYADTTLAEYCRRMQVTETNRNVAIVMLVILLFLFLPVYYFSYYKYVIQDVRKALEKMRREKAVRKQRLAELRDRNGRLSFERDRLHVLDNVMSNSFSAIKHETMYYPSRIRQLLSDAGDDASYCELDEVARYYRAVYGILSQQAMSNCTHQLPPLVLRDILLRHLARMSGQRKADIQPEKTDGKYVVYRIAIKRYDDIRIRICTQIVRDLGEQFALHRCGTTLEADSLLVVIPDIEA